MSIGTWLLFQADLPDIRSYYTALLQQIVELLRQDLGENLLSVFLLGSPARGYATLFRQGDTWEIANDFDLAVVLDWRIEDAKLLDLMRACTRLANPSSRYVRDTFSELDFHVDISQFVQSELTYLAPTLFAADFAYAGLLLNGVETRRAIRFALEDIPRYEAYLLLYNRLCSMIETIQAEYFAIDRREKSTGWNTTLYIAKKGIIDSGAAVLIHQGIYTPNYLERADRLIPYSAERAERYRWWITERSLIDPEQLDGQDLGTIWREGYDAWQFARGCLGIPKLFRNDGQASLRATLFLWKTRIQAAYQLGHWTRGTWPFKALKTVVRSSLSVRDFQQQIKVYARAERLAQEWCAMLEQGMNSERVVWFQERNSTIHAWKSMNWK